MHCKSGIIASVALATALPLTAVAQQEGLVNVALTDNVIQVPVGVAAQICDVDASVIAQDFTGTEDTVCTIDEDTGADAGTGNSNGGGQQKGLVNVDVSGNTVQVPVSVAAQICDLDVNVIARDVAGSEDTACTIEDETTAESDG